MQTFNGNNKTCIIYILIKIYIIRNVIAIKDSIVGIKMETSGKIIKLIKIDLVTIFIPSFK